MRWLQKIRPTKLQTCASCGLAHRLEDMHIGYGRPDLYFTIGDHQREQHWRETTDFAQFGEERFFIRCLAEIAVQRKRHTFAYGVWVEVTGEKYYRYSDIFMDPLQGTEPKFDGAIANHLPMYEPTTLGLPVSVKLRNDRIRPSIHVKDGQHPLALEQERGITVDRVLEIHHTY